MQNAIQSLNFNQNSVRSFVDEKGEMWFLANDICSILDYSNPRRTVSLHCKEKGVTKRYTPTESGNQEMTYINEPNLYRLIIKSRKPEAEAFEEWVMEDVLPTIRKTGSYQTSGSLKTKTALPNGLTLEQQDEIKKFHRELGANDILAIISTKSKHKLMIQYFHNYVLIYRTVLPAHENALIVQKRFLPSA